MAGPFALAAVSAVLKDLLNDGLANHDLSPLGNVLVTALPPDRIPVTAADERSQINIFLYQATHNAALRNLDLPSRSPTGERISNAPLALDLRYLVTAYGREELHGDALLGFAMQVLHENPVLTRAMIDATLRPALPPGLSLPPGLEMISTSDLADQIESIKLVPVRLDTEELARLWSAMQAKYRPTAAYMVSVVLLETATAAKAPLPVLRQGDSGRGGAAAASGLLAPVPTILSVTLPGNRNQALPGDAIAITGHHFSGASGQPGTVAVSARLVNLRTGTRVSVTIPAADRGAFSAGFVLPDLPAEIPTGVYGLQLEIVPVADPDDVRSSNEVALAVSPAITGGLGQIARSGVDPQTGLGDAALAIGCRPDVLPGQRATLILGAREFPAAVRTTPVSALDFAATGMAAGRYHVRLRIDGIDSILVDLSDPDAPAFNASQSVELT